MTTNLGQNGAEISVLLINGREIETSKLLTDKQKASLNTKKESDLKPFYTIDEAGHEQILIPYVPKKPTDQYLTLEQLRNLGHQAFGLVMNSGVKYAYLKSELSQALNFAFAEGLFLSNYSFDKYKKEKKELVEKFISDDDFLSDTDRKTLNNIVKAVFYSRNIVNEPLSTLTAKELSLSAKNFAEEVGISYKELGLAEIKRLNMGGVLGVNAGSQYDPTFTVLEWKPENAVNQQPIILVGKGVVYDTGGYNIKVGDGMTTMKCDMGGAAAVFGGIYLAALEKLPLHIITLVPAVENRINDKAMVAGDVLTISNGLTVEVLNTDAEGRLILSDALSYAQQFKPELVMDFATLTGAAMRAFGHHVAAFMGTADEKTKSLAKEAAFNTYERIAEMPLWDDYGDLLKSEVADISNIGGALAGAITAGKFLQNFTDYPWLHFDIAGPAFLSTTSTYRTSGGTGTGVRFLLEFLKSYMKK
ncbi:MAG: leucyl aminopeptidase family protein [Chitinophagales bacterium]|nr:leucyl aminopeptidase family protein [Chitinophagales bacterium]